MRSRMRAVTVVGASLAGLSAVNALRSQSFDGRIVVVGDERHAPYDRPPLSKSFLAGALDDADLDLGGPSDDDPDVRWRLGTRAARLDPAGSAVVLDTGERVVSDGVVVATGARARPMFPAAPDGVHTLRTLEDARALRADLRPGARLVVIGGGFIGAEVASTARSLRLDVTVVEATPLPLTGPLGATLAGVCADLHAEHGTGLVCSATVTELVGTGGVGTGRVEGVQLADGRFLPADVVVVGIGSAPNTEWLASAGVTSAAGVVTTRAGATAIPSVVAAGDCTVTRTSQGGREVRQEHWSNAQHQPRAAVATLLGVPYRTPTSARVPYFWSDQYGHRLQYAGHAIPTGDRPADQVEIVDGDVAARDFVAVRRRQDQLVGVFAMNRTRAFGRWRRELANQDGTTDP